MEEKWFKKSYRRNLLDMHIPDWDERFLSEFDPKKYVDMILRCFHLHYLIIVTIRYGTNLRDNPSSRPI